MVSCFLVLLVYGWKVSVGFGVNVWFKLGLRFEFEFWYYCFYLRVIWIYYVVCS